MASPEKLKRITPTLQLVMNDGLTFIINALNRADVEEAFNGIQTLVGALREEDYKTLWPKCQALEQKLRNVKGGRNIDFHTKKISVVTIRANILYAEIRTLYRALTYALHEGGYLERRDRLVPTNIPTQLKLEADSQ